MQKFNIVSVDRDHLRNVRARWRAQYCRSMGWNSAKAEKIFNDLVALGDEPTVEQIEAIIGNKSWTRVWCDGCGEYCSRAIGIDNGDRMTHICETCVNAMADMLQMVDARCFVEEARAKLSPALFESIALRAKQ